jgi:alkylglycerol monooxygenase
MRIPLLFLAVLLLEIYGSIAYHRPLVWMTKPLLMPLLMIWAYREGLKDRALYLALFFSFLGDVLLMLDGLFIPGLAAFLLAHLAYIYLFKADYTFQFLPFVLFGICTSAYLVFLYSHIPENMQIPVIAYCTVITGMGIAAASRRRDRAFPYLLLGAILFIVSDALIAFNKFYKDIPNDALYIMSTYGAAQFLLVKAWLKRGFA